ncbi:MAG: F0F1 ATP synthase subunit B [Candidatus Nealsonbacteria bacterium]|nr:F0F1 ATP synthase subunit B [Candidatus Nealsonbacteria bacterium]
MIVTRVIAGAVVGLMLLAYTPGAAGEAVPPPDSHGTVPESSHGDGNDTAGGSHGGTSENPLEFKKDLALWTCVVFLVLLTVLWKFAWGPISQGLSRREKGIADQIAEAQQSNEKARQLLADYEQKLLASKDEVRAILEKARADGEQSGREIVEAARAESESDRKRSLQQIDEATAAALKELADRSATLAVDLAGKIVGETLDRKSHARLIERAMTDFSAGPENN